jgi:hypothetical protein
VKALVIGCGRVGASIARQLDRLASGDLPPALTDVRGSDFNAVRDSLNTCTAAVSALIGDTGTLSRAAVEGRLTTRAARDLRPVTGPFTVLAFQSALGQPDADLMPTERVLSILSLYCEDAHPEAMCAYFEHRFWAVVPLPGGRERERSIALALKTVTAVESLTPIRLAAGIGVAVERVADIPRSRRAAERALAVLEGLDDDRRVVHIADVRSRAVLLDLMELAAERAELREGALQQVLADEPERAGEHRATLRAYLDCSGNVAAAAKHLGIHPNTLRYRVRRLVERTGLDLDDPDQRLVTELQLRMPAAPGAS